MGPRNAAEVEQFSATPADYARVTPQNRAHRALGLLAGDDEHSLFPGVIVLVFAVTAFRPPISRQVWLYAVLAVCAFDASLGPHGLVFAGIERVVPLLTSLRASARFAILVQMSLAMLAAFAAVRLQHQSRWGGVATLIATLVVIVESQAAPLALRPATTVPSEVDRFLSTLSPAAAVVELPLPSPDALWLYETTYQLKSINHWRRLVNGYSGFVPAQYERTLHEMNGFPDATSARRLRELGVAVVVINRARYEAPLFKAISDGLLTSTEFTNLRRVGRGDNEALVVEVRR